jgi:hypothetical protein
MTEGETMNYFQMRALMPQIEKFSALLDSRRICQSRIKTLFKAADKITPQFKAACSGMDIMKKAMLERSVIC